MSRKLYVAFTMDCERIAAESPPGGPESWKFSERAIRGYCEILLQRGFTPTLFCVPECADRHSDMFRHFSERGAEPGLHIHPQSFRDFRYDRYFGEYDRSMQKQILIEALDAVTEALGFRPTSFRPGNLSVSDETYALVAELGFRQGSVSLPGRHAPEFAAFWTGAERYAHWANEHDRLRAGTLPFLEVPLTTDPFRMQPGGGPYEMRIEFGSSEEWHEPILTAALRGMEDDDVPFRSICILTHNFLDYGDSACTHAQTLTALAEHISALPGYDVVPVTLSALRAAYVEQMGEPVAR